MKSKFGRVFRFIGGGSESPPEESFDFLDSDFDEAILYHETFATVSSCVNPCLAAGADRGAAPAELALRIVDGGKLSRRNALYRHAADQLIAA